METVPGADGPSMNKAIVEQLAIEHSVLETGGTRVEVGGSGDGEINKKNKNNYYCYKNQKYYL